MSVGLQIWRKDKIDQTKPFLDVTSRCLNIFGSIETGVWLGKNSWYKKPSELEQYTDEDIFTERKIIIPEFSYGKPFYTICSNGFRIFDNCLKEKNILYQWLINQGYTEKNIEGMKDYDDIRYGLYNNKVIFQFDNGSSFSFFRSVVEPNIVIKGNELTYNYLRGWKDNICGDYDGLLIGAHKIVYGVL